MDQYLKKAAKTLLSSILLIVANSSYSFDLKRGHTTVQLGGYWSDQGRSQHINIQDLIGDDFNVTNSKGSNGIVGIGYFIDAPQKGVFHFNYGINAFYLGKTAVKGTVVQESIFTNLAYRYSLTHFPLLVVAKSTLDSKSPHYALTLDIGVGPNFMHANGFSESSLDGITVPDSIFAAHLNTTFSAMAGIGVKLNNIFGHAPLECGYKFFYLGQGRFNNINHQVLNTLNTGNDYANAVLCSITV